MAIISWRWSRSHDLCYFDSGHLIHWLRSVKITRDMRWLVLDGGGGVWGGAGRGSRRVVLFTGFGATTVPRVQQFNIVCQFGDIISGCLLCQSLRVSLLFL